MARERDMEQRAVQPNRSSLEVRFDHMRDAYGAEPYPSYETRLDRLKRLEIALEKNQQRLMEAMSADFSYRSEMDCQALDIMPTVGLIHYTRRRLRKWMRTRRVPMPLYLMPARARIMPQPLGVVGVISPWNFPIYLSLPPVATAIAAGNRVMLKPSELSPATSQAMSDMIGSAFSEDEIAVVLGDAAVASEFSTLPFDHLMFTGSTAVGRKVAMAAAKNLTPVTLELGGKSPAVVTPSADLDRAARRIAWGKVANAGQVCVSPDYALVPRPLMGAFAGKLEQVLREFFPDGTASKGYSAIISERHRARLEDMVTEAGTSGAQIIRLPDTEKDKSVRKIAPAIVVNPDQSLTVMREEVFGPILSIIPYDKPEEAAAFVAGRDRPLALYIFAERQDDIDFWLRNSHSGGVCVNETTLHVAVDGLPFGGVGASGMGAYHGDRGFETFSHMKSVFIQPKLNGVFIFDPPVVGWKRRLADLVMKIV